MAKLTVLQSRLLSSVIATALIAILYFALSSAHFAYASDVDSIFPEDHNHERLLSPYILPDELVDIEDENLEYEPEFLGTNRGIIGRQVPIAFEVVNNVPRLDNVIQGATVYYVFTNRSLWSTKSEAGSGLPSPGLVRIRDEGDNGIEPALPIEETAEHVSHYEDGEGGQRIGKRANTTRTVYITLNTCLQPSNAKDPTGSLGPPPQLTLYVSQNNTRPGPNQPAGTQEMVKADQGFANVTFEASKDVYIGVSAPNTTTYSGVYNVEIAASIDGQYHSYNGANADLFFIDSDSSSALLATKNLTLEDADSEIYNKWMQLKPPYTVFANNQNDSVISGVSHSYCGLEKYAKIAGTQGGVRTNMVQTSMTNVTLGNFPKQQFYFQGLNASSSYFGILAMSGNSTAHGNGVVGGGGQVWQTMNFTTQSGESRCYASFSHLSALRLTFPDGNCAVIFNLTFCSTVNYAVPGNPKTFPNVNDLAAFYDNTAASAYANFSKALQQIPCEIPSTGQYSLVRTCADCAAAYKAWLCTVTIPRCQDFSRSDPWLQPRNVVQAFPNMTMLSDALVADSRDVMFLNSSRNPLIDEQVQPGPYKEILPCQDLCYNLVQSCPAAMGFACPRPGKGGFASSYGFRPNGSANEDGQITCNYPGAAYRLSGARGVEGGAWGVMAGVVVGLGMMLL
jgi:calcium channel MID1